MLPDDLTPRELPEYIDCQLGLEAAAGGGYAAQLTLDDGSSYRSAAPIQFDNAALLELSTTDRAAYGRQLFQLFLSGKPREGLAAARTRARAEHKHLRLSLKISPDAQPLHPLNWELLRDEEGDLNLAAAPDLAFSRFLDVDAPLGTPVQERPLRVLVVIANPNNLESEYGLPQLDVGVEHDKIAESFASAGRQIQCVFLQGEASLANIRRTLEDGHFHVLHVLGHGLFSQAEQKGYLALEKASDHTVAKTGETEFADLFSGLTDVRLVVLAACLSAARSQANAFLGLGPALVARGIPAVVAMQRPVPISAAQTFTSTFYAELSQLGYVDAAVSRARYDMALDPEHRRAGDWAIPVLFMRTRNGLLFYPNLAASGARLPPQVRDSYLPILQLFVDRDDQYREFQDLVNNAQAAHAARIQSLFGPVGMGKSWLLSKYALWCTEENVAWSLVDFETREPWDYLLTLQRLVPPALNDPALAEYCALQQRITAAGLENAHDPATRSQLTRAFVQALSHLANGQRVALLLDNLDQHDVQPIIADWLVPELLARFQDRTLPLAHVTVVVTTQELPTFAGQWDTLVARAALEPLDKKNFLRFARLRGVNLPQEVLEGIYLAVTADVSGGTPTPQRFAFILDKIGHRNG